MRWMHISDIHMNKENNKVLSDILREKLPLFIKENKIEADYLFLTGDYRDSNYMKDPSMEEELEAQASNVVDYILEIAETLDVKADKIYLTPGNHDLDRREEDRQKIAEIKKQYPQYRESFSEKERKDLLERFVLFDCIDRKIHPEQKEKCRANHRFYPGKGADILCLNTAISCYGEEKERELIIDTGKIKSIVNRTVGNIPLIVLAHHDMSFLTEEEEENMNAILGSKVFYLCGHSHKFEFSYDDANKMWKIMDGTTKYAEGAYPIVSVAETNSTGELICLKVYQYGIVSKTEWSLYQEIAFKNHLSKLWFTGRKMGSDVNIAFDTICLPFWHTESSNATQREEAVKRLAELKSNLCGLEGKREFIVASDGLPVNAAILIGYALNARQGIQLVYKSGESIYANVKTDNCIKFEINFTQPDTINCTSKESIPFYIYIQAKSRDDGFASFNHIDKEGGYIAAFTNKETYNETFNLERSAKELVDLIWEKRDFINRKTEKKVDIHLFYNGFWGLALLLGNQLSSTYPIHLYDYNGTDQQYHESFLLQSDLF